MPIKPFTELLSGKYQAVFGKQIDGETASFFLLSFLIVARLIGYVNIGGFMAVKKSPIVKFDELCDVVLLNSSVIFRSLRELCVRMRKLFDGGWTTHSVLMLTDYLKELNADQHHYLLLPWV